MPMQHKNKLPSLPFFSFVILGMMIFSIPAYSVEKSLDKESFWEQTDLYLELTPSFLFNTYSKKISAPSPAFFPLTVGIAYPNDSFFSVEPSLSFFWTYYLVYDGLVLPAEIENRTATALSFLINIPAVFSFSLTAESRMNLGVGTAFLLRFPFLASGVNSGDYGWYGSTEDDVSYMFTSFYESGRFFYLSLKASWIFYHMEKIGFGPVFSMNFPIITAFKDKNVSGMILEAGLQVVF